MKNSLQRRALSGTMALLVFTSFSISQAAAHEHIVSLSELQGRVRSAAQGRARNLEDTQRVLSYPAAAAALKRANVRPEQMRAAVATLSDEELARLSERARASEKDVEGGLIFGILALIGLIVVIVIVATLVAEADFPGPEPSTLA
jgi:hypothetical protein